MSRARRLVSAVLSLLLTLQPLWALGEVRLLFLNVGKGDAILIEGEGFCYLLDTGTKKNTDQIKAGLSFLNRETLEGILITHADKDHCGGLKKLLKAGLCTGKVYISSCFAGEKEKSHPAIQDAQDTGTPLQELSAGDTLALGEGVTLQVLGPLRENEESEDDNSLVLLLTTPWGTALLCGDMTQTEEADLLSAGVLPQADLLKVGHHGKKDATSIALVKTVSPKLAVISSDDAGSSSVTSRLMQAGAEILFTQDAELGWLVTFSENQPDGPQVSKLENP